jgi:hypothetical protein
VQGNIQSRPAPQSILLFTKAEVPAPKGENKLHQSMDAFFAA